MDEINFRNLKEIADLKSRKKKSLGKVIKRVIIKKKKDAKQVGNLLQPTGISVSDTHLMGRVLMFGQR